MLELCVNGRIHHLDVSPDAPLLYVLRNDLGLKSVKSGCDLGQCGACTILVDGRPRTSCRMTVADAQDHELITLEGLGDGETLDPIQQAFVDEGAVQCGFCTPGMIMSARALLNRTPQPTDEQINAALAGNLCRCGIYDRVLRAILRAAGQPLPKPAAIIDEPGPDETYGPLPSPLLHTPSLDAWLRLDAEGTLSVFCGKVELGQDLRTSVGMIAADELDVNLSRVRVTMADTEATPNEGGTGSSMSLETSGNAIRYAAAEARAMLLAQASEELGAPLERLVVTDGLVSDPESGRSIDYWTLHGGKRFGCPVSGLVRPKRAEKYTLLGRSQSRLDITAKVRGKHTFVHDMDLPGMLHARLVRPPSYHATLLSVDQSVAADMAGVVSVVHDGSYLAVIAEREEQAIAGSKALAEAVVWQDDAHLPAQAELPQHMLAQKDYPYRLVGGTPVRDALPAIIAPERAAQTLSATYFKAYHAHASLGPSAAVGQLVDGKLTIWTHSQAPYPVRDDIAFVLGMASEDVHLIYTDGAGSFGHNGQDDVAMDAALLALAVPGRPVSIKWTRANENQWEPYGPAAVIQMQASLDEAGEIIDWNHDVWSYTHGGRPGHRGNMVALMPAWFIQQAFDRPQAGPSMGAQTDIHRNAEPLYAFEGKRIAAHFLADSPLRTSAYRGLGSYANVFAMESFLDEVVHAAGADPVAYRLRYMQDPRARAVIEAVAQRANWQPRERPSGGGAGRGFAFAQYKNRQVYVAAVVDLHVDQKTGRIILDHAVLGSDAGQAVNPDSLSGQIEGGFVQSASWTLREEVKFDHQAVTSTDWRSYPILRASDTPTIETVLINRPGLPILGVGEGVMGPAPAAIANAVFDAVGIRLRQVPFTPDRVLEALEASRDR